MPARVDQSTRTINIAWQCAALHKHQAIDVNVDLGIERLAQGLQEVLGLLIGRVLVWCACAAQTQHCRTSERWVSRVSITTTRRCLVIIRSTKAHTQPISSPAPAPATAWKALRHSNTRNTSHGPLMLHLTCTRPMRSRRQSIRPSTMTCVRLVPSE